jgi:uncharacterized membrane protein YdjX (TVP38/TMEM64 family)
VTSPPDTSKNTKLRLLLLAVVLIGLFAAGKYTGVADDVDAERVRELMAAAGPWGFALYTAVFAAGEFMHIPGLVFIAAGILFWGQALGFLLALTASVVSVCCSFAVVRLLGGTPLARLDKPWAKRMLARLDDKPIRTVFVLRLCLWLAPPLNYALALTRVSFRDYAIGSALGLILPVAAATLLFDWLF